MKIVCNLLIFLSLFCIIVAWLLELARCNRLTTGKYWDTFSLSWKLTVSNKGYTVNLRHFLVSIVEFKRNKRIYFFYYRFYFYDVRGLIWRASQLKKGMCMRIYLFIFWYNIFNLVCASKLKCSRPDLSSRDPKIFLNKNKIMDLFIDLIITNRKLTSC